MAAWDEFLYSITLEAGEDLSAEQYRFVDIDTARARSCVVTGDGGTARTVGVLQNAPDAVGNAATVGVQGVSRVEAGAAVVVGALVSADATGKAVTATTGERVLGVALEAASATGEIIPIKLGYLGAAA